MREDDPDALLCRLPLTTPGYIKAFSCFLFSPSRGIWLSQVEHIPHAPIYYRLASCTGFPDFPLVGLPQPSPNVFIQDETSYLFLEFPSGNRREGADSCQGHSAQTRKSLPPSRTHVRSSWWPPGRTLHPALCTPRQYRPAFAQSAIDLAVPQI